MTRGFTLVEVVVALLILEIAVAGALGLLVLSSRTLTAAEELERAVAIAEGAFDSLARTTSRVSGGVTHVSGEVRWSVGSAGATVFTATDSRGRTLFEIPGTLPP